MPHDFLLCIIFYLNKGHYHVHAVPNLVLSLFPAPHTHTHTHTTHTHTHTHTHRVIFSLKKRKSHSCTPAFEEWCLGKTTRETACSLCLCTMHACVLSCSVVSNSTTEKIFFFKKRAIQGTFLMSPVIKRLHLPMIGCRINPWSGNPTCLEAKNPKHKKKKNNSLIREPRQEMIKPQHKKKKNNSLIREPRQEMIKPQNKMENYRAEETNCETLHH